MEQETIIVVGATGNLGMRVVKALLAKNASVKVIVRNSSSPRKLDELRFCGARTAVSDLNRVDELATHFEGASCVVSTLLGLRETMIETQTNVLNAAVKAGVPRFIPSDYCIDFTKLKVGENRNLDLHREFQTIIDESSIEATSILNGAFMDLLLGQAPLIQRGIKRVLYWEDADQLLDFTTIDDTASFTAATALDTKTPRFLRIAGEQISAGLIADTMTFVTGQRFRVLRAGSLNTLRALTNITRTLSPPTNDPFPAWQGMQYFCNMFEGHVKLNPLDNNRYSDIKWTGLEQFLNNEQIRWH